MSKYLAMKKGGMLLAEVFAETLKTIKPGSFLSDIDSFANNLIVQRGAWPSFKKVKGYHWATCLNVNEGVVHGIPAKRRVQKNDIVSLDMGVYYKSYHTDMAFTFLLNGDQASGSDREFLKTGEKALGKAIKTARPKARISDVSGAIQTTVEKAGYSCVESLTGHGIGKNLHEKPFVPCVVPKGKKDEQDLLRENMALAIEVIYTTGSGEILSLRDDWTICTKDGKISALFEKTVYIHENRVGAEVLTPFLWEENVQ